MPVAGSYRSIDFALSNMTNSHIQKVAVLTQYNARSLNEHLSSSKWWDFGRKQGGLRNHLALRLTKHFLVHVTMDESRI